MSAPEQNETTATAANLDTEEAKQKAEIAKLNADISKMFTFPAWINRFYGRSLALLLGVGAVLFVCGPVSAILSADIRTFFPSEISVIKTMVVDKPPQKAVSTPSTTTGPVVSDASLNTVSGEESAAYVSMAWVYGIKVFGSIAVLCALLWTLMALVRSDPDQRD